MTEGDGGRRAGSPARLRVLVVEDDPPMAALLLRGLRQRGFEVELAADVSSARAALAAARVDVIVLDLMLPVESGFALLEWLQGRPSSPAVLVLSARPDLEARVRSFLLGALDFVPKPFFMEELVLRLRTRLGHVEAAQPVLAWADAQLDVGGRRVLVGGHTVQLTTYEFDVLAYLAARPGRTISREQLAERALRGAEPPEPRTIDSYINRIRKKLGDPSAVAIGTVWGIGYRFTPPGDE